MLRYAAFEIPKPKNWQDFERHAKILFESILEDPQTQLHGRSGQKQSGVDIFGRRSRTGGWVGVQCKAHGDGSVVTERELHEEVQKAKLFRPQLSEFYLLTTARTDAAIQAIARAITEEEKQSASPLSVAVWGWDTLECEICRHERALLAFHPDASPISSIMMDYQAAAAEETARMRRDLGQVQENSATIRNDVAELLQLARSAGIIGHAQSRQISEAAIRAVVEKAGGIGVPPENFIAWLNNWIEEAEKKLSAFHKSEEGDFDVLRARSAEILNSGNMAAISTPFTEEIGRCRAADAERSSNRKQYYVRLLEEAISYERLAFNAEAACERLWELAKLDCPDGSLGAWDAFNGRILEFRDEGLSRGDRSALLIAIRGIRILLVAYDRSRFARYWAYLQDSLGLVLGFVGMMDADRKHLSLALDAFNHALSVRTKLVAPLDWRATSNNAANRLVQWGLLEGDPSFIGEAIATYRSCLDLCSYDHERLEWTTLQYNLSAALDQLGTVSADSKYYYECLTTAASALKVWTSESHPLDWSSAINLLGVSLYRIGGQLQNGRLLRRAAAAHRMSLRGITRRANPLEWAQYHSNIGDSMWSLARMADRHQAGILRYAARSYKIAVQTYEERSSPIDWASALNNFGGVALALWHKTSDSEWLDEALDAFQSAARQLTQDRNLAHWSAVQENIGRALWSIALRDRKLELLPDAELAFRNALGAKGPGSAGTIRPGEARYNLGSVLLLRGYTSKDRSALVEAESHLSQAVELLRTLNDATLMAQASTNLTSARNLLL